MTDTQHSDIVDLLRSLEAHSYGEDVDMLDHSLQTAANVRADVDLMATTALIELDVSGDVRRVTVNRRSMEPVAPSDGADIFYRAYRQFCEVLQAPDECLEFALGDGDLIAFDNRRVLHGRGAYTQDPDRHLQGCYANMDAIESAARRLRARPGPT